MLHKKLLIQSLFILLLIVGCASQPIKPIMLLDGETSSNSITFKTDEIKAECKIGCKTYSVSSDEWCDCMYKCIRNVIDENSLEDEDEYLIIPVEGCSIDDFKNKLTK